MSIRESVTSLFFLVDSKARNLTLLLIILLSAARISNTIIPAPVYSVAIIYLTLACLSFVFRKK